MLVELSNYRTDEMLSGAAGRSLSPGTYKNFLLGHATYLSIDLGRYTLRKVCWTAIDRKVCWALRVAVLTGQVTGCCQFDGPSVAQSTNRCAVG